jgi:hypothetical protein
MANLTSKFHGYVVRFPGNPDYKNLDKFLKVVGVHGTKGTLVSSTKEATLFNTEEEANSHLSVFRLLGDDAHLAPEVNKVWILSELTLTDPDVKSAFRHMVDGVKSAKSV